MEEKVLMVPYWVLRDLIGAVSQQDQEAAENMARKLLNDAEKEG